VVLGVADDVGAAVVVTTVGFVVVDEVGLFDELQPVKEATPTRTTTPASAKRRTMSPTCCRSRQIESLDVEARSRRRRPGTSAAGR